MAMQIPERNANLLASDTPGAAEGSTGPKAKERRTVSFAVEPFLEETRSPSLQGVAWETNGPACSVCAVSFGCFKRRHHCRLCGEGVCRVCSKNKIELAGHRRPQRACNACINGMTGRDKNMRSIALACGTMRELLGKEDVSGGLRTKHDRMPQQVVELLSNLTAELSEDHRSHSALAAELAIERLHRMETMQYSEANMAKLEELLDKSKRSTERIRSERASALQAILQLGNKIGSIADESGASPAEQPPTLEGATQLCSESGAPPAEQPSILQLGNKIGSIADESGARPAEQPLTLEGATQLCGEMTARLERKLQAVDLCGEMTARLERKLQAAGAADP